MFYLDYLTSRTQSIHATQTHTHSHMNTCFPRAKAAEEHQGWSCLLTFEPVAFCRNAVARGQLAGEVPGPAPTHTLIVFSIQSIVSIGCNKFQLNPAAKLWWAAPLFTRFSWQRLTLLKYNFCARLYQLNLFWLPALVISDFVLYLIGSNTLSPLPCFTFEFFYEGIFLLHFWVFSFSTQWHTVPSGIHHCI